MADKHPKRPRDPAQLAKLIVDIARGEEKPSKPKTKHPKPSQEEEVERESD